MGFFSRRSRADRDEEILRSVLETSRAQSEAVATIAKAFATYIESFKVDGRPEVRDHADIAAYERETIQEMEAKGLPMGSTELDRLRWIARQVDFSS